MKLFQHLARFENVAQMMAKATQPFFSYFEMYGSWRSDLDLNFWSIWTGINSMFLKMNSDGKTLDNPQNALRSSTMKWMLTLVFFATDTGCCSTPGVFTSIEIHCQFIRCGTIYGWLKIAWPKGTEHFSDVFEHPLRDGQSFLKPFSLLKPSRPFTVPLTATLDKPTAWPTKERWECCFDVFKSNHPCFSWGKRGMWHRITCFKQAGVSKSSRLVLHSLDPWNNPLWIPVVCCFDQVFFLKPQIVLQFCSL